MAGGRGVVWTGAGFGSVERAFRGQRHGLGYLEQLIGQQEQLVTRQQRIVAAAAACRLSSGPARDLLHAMETNLAKLHAWRLRLLSLSAPEAKPKASPSVHRRATMVHEPRARPRTGAPRVAAALR